MGTDEFPEGGSLAHSAVKHDQLHNYVAFVYLKESDSGVCIGISYENIFLGTCIHSLENEGICNLSFQRGNLCHCYRNDTFSQTCHHGGSYAC